MVAALDQDGDGCISASEFMELARPRLNERRAALVQQAFKCLDRDGDGIVTIRDIAAKFDSTGLPGVLLPLSSLLNAREHGRGCHCTAEVDPKKCLTTCART